MLPLPGGQTSHRSPGESFYLLPSGWKQICRFSERLVLVGVFGKAAVQAAVQAAHVTVALKGGPWDSMRVADVALAQLVGVALTT